MLLAREPVQTNSTKTHDGASALPPTADIWSSLPNAADTIHVGDTFEAYKLKENIDTLVLGGGQAGLSVSWHLKKAGRDHLVLDRGRIGDTWRRRWDSFCLVTPNCYCQFPEFPYDGDNPEGFMLRDEIVGYVERFARSFDPPYRAGVDVQRVEPSSTGRGFFR